MDPFIGEVRMMGFGFAPNGWALCNGALLPIRQYTALFSLLGTNFGGDGKTTFGIPNLQGAAPMGAGNGTGLSQRALGQTGGSATVTLQQSQIPAHTHTMMSAPGRSPSTSNTVAGNAFTNATGNAYAPAGSQAQMAGAALQSSGGSGPHNNMMPYLTVTFAIALQGSFPPRP